MAQADLADKQAQIAVLPAKLAAAQALVDSLTSTTAVASDVQRLQLQVNALTGSAQDAATALRAAEQRVSDADSAASAAEAEWMDAEDEVDKAMGSSDTESVNAQLKQVSVWGSGWRFQSGWQFQEGQVWGDWSKLGRRRVFGEVMGHTAAAIPLVTLLHRYQMGKQHVWVGDLLQCWCD